jgi:hypothetical protein
LPPLVDTLDTLPFGATFTVAVTFTLLGASAERAET